MLKKRIILLLSKYYFRILSLKKRVDFIVLCPRALGDTCFALSMSQYITSKYKCSFYIYLGYREIIESCYNIKNNANIIYYKPQTFLSAMLLYTLAPGGLGKVLIKSNVICAIPFAFFPSDSQINSTYIDFLEKGIIGEKFNITYPVMSNKLLQKEKQKYIILNPYSNSMEIKNINVWDKIVEYARKEGYVVYTNTIKNQHEISGTIKMNCSFIEMYEKVKNAVMFVSIRSGIVDFTISTGTPHYIIYYDNNDKCLDYNMKAVYPLSQWRTGSFEEKYYSCDDDVFDSFRHYFDSYSVK